jgi:hypothetical protein
MELPQLSGAPLRMEALISAVRLLVVTGAVGAAFLFDGRAAIGAAWALTA